MKNFTFSNSQFTFNSHLLFTRQAAAAGLVCEMLNVKLMKNVKCKMINVSEGGQL